MLAELEHFVLVARHGTFTHAARAAGLSQPALTASIQRLEAALGASLFDRGRSGARLTAAGEVLLPRAHGALAAVEDGRRAVAEVVGLEAGVIRLASAGTPTLHYLPKLLAEFRRAHPRIRVELREATPAEARQALASGAVDLAITTDAGGEPLFDDELILVVAPDVDPSTAPFVGFRPGASSRALLDETFPDADVAVQLASVSAVVAHVRAGLGVALVSRTAVEAELGSGGLRVVPDARTPVRRTFKLLHRGLERLPPAALAFRAAMFDRDAAASARESV